MQPSHDAIVASIARQLGANYPGAYQVTPLTGGLTNATYKLVLSTEGGRGRPTPEPETYVVRICGENAPLLGIDRDHERVVTRIVDELGVGAGLVLVDEGRDVLVTRFIEGQVLAPGCGADEALLARLVETIRRVHQGPDFPGRFLPVGAARALAACATERGVTLPPDLDRAFALGDKLIAAMGDPVNRRPCHNDLLAANFIDEGGRLRLIDWEYAAMGDPAFDLGNLATNLEMDDATEARLVALYAGRDRPADRARVRLMRVVSDLREACWGFAQVAIAAPGDIDYFAHGQQHLTRLLAMADTTDFAASLETTK